MAPRVRQDDAPLDALFINPPYTELLVYSVYPAAYWLAEHLMKKGYRAGVLDMNREYLTLLANREHLSERLEICTRERRLLEQKTRLVSAERDRYFANVKLGMRLRSLLDHYDEICTPENMQHLNWSETRGDHSSPNRRFTHLFRDLIDLSYPHSESYELLRLLPFADRLAKGLETPAAVQFGRSVHDLLRNKLDRTAPRLIGFSIPFAQLLYTSLLMAKEIRAIAPDTHICFGGPVITLLDPKATESLLSLGAVDSLVKYAGENVIVDLLEHSKDSTWLRSLPSVSVPSEGPQLPSLPRPSIPTSNGSFARRYPPSSLEHLPRRRPMQLAVFQSSGCYWGKCTFCDYVNLHECDRYAPRSASAIVDDLEYYSRMGFERFSLITEALPPKHAKKIAEEILARKLTISWAAYIRVDRGFNKVTFELLRKSGFEKPAVGMESSNSRLLGILNKGYAEDDVRKFIEAACGAGFSTLRLNVILDVPTTTLDEALSVFEFCRSHKHCISDIALSLFTVTTTSEMGMDPSKFGIELTGEPAATNGQMNAVRHSDPDGLKNDEKRRLMQLYAELRQELSEKLEFNGLFEKIRDAKKVPDLKGLRFSFFSPDLFVHDRPKFSLDGEVDRNRDRYLFSSFAHPQSTGYVSEGWLTLYRTLAGETGIKIDRLLERLQQTTECDLPEAENAAVSFVKQCAAMRLLERVEST